MGAIREFFDSLLLRELVKGLALTSSLRSKLSKNSRIAPTSGSDASCYFQMFHGVCIQTATTTSHTRVIGMNTFQPSRMIWS